MNPTPSHKPRRAWQKDGTTLGLPANQEPLAAELLSEFSLMKHQLPTTGQLFWTRRKGVGAEWDSYIAFSFR